MSIAAIGGVKTVARDPVPAGGRGVDGNKKNPTTGVLQGWACE